MPPEKTADQKLTEALSQITALTTMVNSLMQQSEQTGPRIIRRGVTERKLRLRFINGKPVIGYANRGTETAPRYVYEAPDPQDPKNNKLYVDLIIKDMVNPLRVSYNEFLQEGESVEVKILKTDVDEVVTEQGTVKHKEVDGYSMIETDVSVPLEVVSSIRKFTVQLPDGQEIVVDENSGVLNI